MEILQLFRRAPALLRLWLGALISGIGDVFTWTALTWYLVERTNSGAAVGTMLLCFSLPAVLTGGWLGKLLDRVQPRPVMMLDNLLRAVLIALIPLFDRLNALPLVVVYGITALMGALAPATRVGTRLLTPHLVQDKDLETANGALALTEQLPGVLGPVLAGFAIHAWGAPQALLLDAVSFLALIWAVATMPNITRQGPTEAPKASGSILWRYPAAAFATVLSFIFFFSYGPTEAALPFFAKNRLHTDAAGLGWLWTAVSVGSIFGSMTTGWIGRTFPANIAMSGIAVLWGVCQAGVAFSHNLPIAMASFFVGGIIWGPYLAIEASFLQRTVPTEEHGAFFGIHTAFLSPAMPLGAALGGALLVRFSPSDVLLIAAVACFIAGLGALFLPRLRR